MPLPPLPAPLPAPLPTPLPLSVAIICRDNEATIARTLASIAGLAAEVIAVDSGSSDRTIPILETHHARIIRTAWRGHIAAKQLALDACTQPWVLSLDSDESLEPDLRDSISRALGADDPALSAFRINRKVYYRSRPLNHAWQPEWRMRLVRRGHAAWTGLDPHDRLELLPAAPGRTADLPGALRHDAIPTFADFLARQAGHARTSAHSLAAAGRRGSLLALALSPPGAFLRQLVLRQAWRDGWPGWLAAASTGAATLMKHAILIEITRSAPTGPEDSPPAAEEDCD